MPPLWRSIAKRPTQPLLLLGAELTDTTLPHERIRFAHNSERQFARLLDFYGVTWEYEPTEFVLERDGSGQPSMAFRPDFFLSEHNLFIEITTLNQKLVTKKNQKVRRLRELHPDLNITILYQRDYLALLIKYGLESPNKLSAADLAAAKPLDLGFDASAARPSSE